MMRRYGLLLAVAVLVALFLGLLIQRPRSTPRTLAEAPPPKTVPVAAAVEVTPIDVVASPDTIAVGREVALVVTNHTTSPITVELSGYEDRVRVQGLPAESTFSVRFLADRPGDQLAWLVDGTPRARLDIRGSHLVAGHR